MSCHGADIIVSQPIFRYLKDFATIRVLICPLKLFLLLHPKLRTERNYMTIWMGTKVSPFLFFNSNVTESLVGKYLLHIKMWQLHTSHPCCSLAKYRKDPYLLFKELKIQREI